MLSTDRDRDPIPAPMRNHSELTITGPLGQGIRYQWLAINRDLIRKVIAPSWEEFTIYPLFKEVSYPVQGMQPYYPSGNFVLDTLNKGPGYYQNIMGLTMYNEGQEEFLCSLRGIWRNLKTSITKDRPMGRNLVIVLVDGFTELHKDQNKPFIDSLENKYKLYNKKAVEQGVEIYKELKAIWQKRYNKDLDKKKAEFMEEKKRTGNQNLKGEYDIPITDKDIVFAFESRLAYGSADMYATTESSRENPAIDIIFMVKAENRKKLHSHLWLFYGFCMHFQPLHVFLIDMGTEPMKKSLIALYDHLRTHKRTGGCCGEIIVKDVAWYDPLVGAQWFEYKIGHIIHKTFESFMGFIPVLPGAFSAYRWKTLYSQDFSVLKAYFLPFIDPKALDWTLTNIYFLAEDRIMSEEIVQVSEDRDYYNLRFVKSAKALTEGVNRLVTLIKQRRRWINGTWFAMMKVLLGCTLLGKVWKSNQPCLWRVKFTFQSMYMLAMATLTWFSVGVFYIAYSMVARVRSTQRIFCPGDCLQVVSSALENSCNPQWSASDQVTSACGFMLYLYIYLMACNTLVSLATTPENVEAFWIVLCWFFSACGVFIVIGLIDLVASSNFALAEFTTYEAGALIVVMAIAVLCYWENFFTIAVFSAYYAILTPTYVNILMVYAVCKTDDVTWGTRGKDEKGSSLQDEFNWKKTVFLVLFAACNVLLGGLVE